MALGSILESLTKNWWVLLLRGIVAILFGVMAFSMPGLTAVTLILLYGVYFLIDGVTAIFAGGSSRAWGLLISGIISVLAGICTFVFPGAAALTLIYVIAFWAIFRGIFEIVAAIQVRKEIQNEWLIIIGGIFSILFGIALFASPGAGLIGMVWFIGAFAICFGVVMIILAFKLKGLPGHVRSALRG